jgi:hypothetical protein
MVLHPVTVVLAPVVPLVAGFGRIRQRDWAGDEHGRSHGRHHGFHGSVSVLMNVS